MRRKYSNKINNKQVNSQKLRINVIFYVFSWFYNCLFCVQKYIKTSKNKYISIKKYSLLANIIVLCV